MIKNLEILRKTIKHLVVPSRKPTGLSHLFSGNPIWDILNKDPRE